MWIMGNAYPAKASVLDAIIVLKKMYALHVSQMHFSLKGWCACFAMHHYHIAKLAKISNFALVAMAIYTLQTKMEIVCPAILLLRDA
jgi:hypothetical protein